MLQVHAHRAVNPVVFTVDAYLLCCMQLRISELSSKSQVHASRAVNPVDIHFLARDWKTRCIGEEKRKNNSLAVASMN